MGQQRFFITFAYSYLSNKRRVANDHRVWKKTFKPTLINEGSGTNGGPGIFVTLLYKEAFENSYFFRFSANFSLIFFKDK